ncbi:MAG: transposase [Planctomycetia bacterium]|nr:transposase [Planctomycetia bacterium]
MENHPRQTRNYAKSRNLLAKTDKIDAKMLAEFAQERRPELRKMPSETYLRLQELLKC